MEGGSRSREKEGVTRVVLGGREKGGGKEGGMGGRSKEMEIYI